MKILGLEVTGIKHSVGQNNSGLFSGVILVDLTTGDVSFNPVGSGVYYRETGVVELHRTSNLKVNKASMADIKAQIGAHLLTMRESGMDPDEYSRELTWVGSGHGKGDELWKSFNNHLTSLTSGVR